MKDTFIKKPIILAAVIGVLAGLTSFDASAECEPRELETHSAKRLMDSFSKEVKPTCFFGRCKLEIKDLRCSGDESSHDSAVNCTFTDGKNVSHEVQGAEAQKLLTTIKQVHGSWLTFDGVTSAANISCRLRRGHSPAEDQYKCTTIPDLEKDSKIAQSEAVTRESRVRSDKMVTK